MDNLLQVILLGIIEGITEFLPISSTGHLLIAQHWLGARSELFTVAIQAGAILAVVAIYWQRLWELTLNLAQPANRDYLFKLLDGVRHHGGRRLRGKADGTGAAGNRGAGRLGDGRSAASRSS